MALSIIITVNAYNAVLSAKNVIKKGGASAQHQQRRRRTEASLQEKQSRHTFHTTDGYCCWQPKVEWDRGGGEGAEEGDKDLLRLSGDREDRSWQVIDIWQLTMCA